MGECADEHLVTRGQDHRAADGAILCYVDQPHDAPQLRRGCDRKRVGRGRKFGNPQAEAASRSRARSQSCLCRAQRNVHWRNEQPRRNPPNSW